MRPSGVVILILLAAGFSLSLLPAVGKAVGSSSAATACRVSQLAVGEGQQVSAYSGQNPEELSLTNRGRVACVLRGYPVISFKDRAGRVPFTIRHGGDMEVTPHRPRTVLIGPGDDAYVLVNNYRCDLGPVRIAQTLTLRLPGKMPEADGALTIHTRRSYCGKGDSGSTVTVSPFEPTVRATLNI
jgi:hypothetical protein